MKTVRSGFCSIKIEHVYFILRIQSISENVYFKVECSMVTRFKDGDKFSHFFQYPLTRHRYRFLRLKLFQEYASHP